VRIESAAARLPAGQRAVFLLRDVEGWSSEDVCSALEISGSNQRVLLHRARHTIRAELEDYLEGGESP
jgi:RNA polymerase sigma-70 factor (ECF subfamily)